MFKFWYTEIIYRDILCFYYYILHSTAFLLLHYTGQILGYTFELSLSLQHSAQICIHWTPQKSVGFMVLQAEQNMGIQFNKDLTETCSFKFNSTFCHWIAKALLGKQGLELISVKEKSINKVKEKTVGLDEQCRNIWRWLFLKISEYWISMELAEYSWRCWW